VDRQLHLQHLRERHPPGGYANWWHNAYTDPNPHGYTDTDADTYINTNSYTNAHSDADTDSYAY
jgi:hypothetical protein